MTMTRVLSMTIITATLATVAPAVSACGVCVEDKVAATYDPAVISRAIANRQQVVFVAVDGPVDGDAIGRKVAKASVKGVVAGTVRVSAAPAAFSFVLDAREQPARAVDGFRRALADPRAELTLVRIARDGRLVEP
jgi:hypothetical protein